MKVKVKVEVFMLTVEPRYVSRCCQIGHKYSNKAPFHRFYPYVPVLETFIPRRSGKRRVETYTQQHPLQEILPFSHRHSFPACFSPQVSFCKNPAGRPCTSTKIGKPPESEPARRAEFGKKIVANVPEEVGISSPNEPRRWSRVRLDFEDWERRNFCIISLLICRSWSRELVLCTSHSSSRTGRLAARAQERHETFCFECCAAMLNRGALCLVHRPKSVSLD